MVLQTFKRFFSRRSSGYLRGTLYRSSTHLTFECSLSYTSTHLLFIQNKVRREVLFACLSDFEYIDGKGSSNILKFRVCSRDEDIEGLMDDGIYYFASMSDMCVLFQEIRKILRPIDIRFECKDIVFCEYVNGNFVVKESNCNLFIYKDIENTGSDMFSSDIYSKTSNASTGKYAKGKNSSVNDQGSSECLNKYVLSLSTATKDINHTIISPKIQTRTEPSLFTFIWNVPSDNSINIFCIKLPNHILFLEFMSKFCECIYQGNDIEVKELIVNNLTKEINNNENVTNSTFTEYEIYNDESYLFESSSEDEMKGNDYLCLGSSNKVYVNQNNSIGVFNLKHDSLDFQTSIIEYNNGSGSLKKMIEHGNNLIFLNENESDIYSLDLGTGRVVEKWDMGDKIVVDYFDEHKMRYGNCLVGIGENEIYRIDPRTKEKKVSINECKENNQYNNNFNEYQRSNNIFSNGRVNDYKTNDMIVNREGVIQNCNSYKTKVGFTTGNSTSTGDVAIANEKGEIRLYDKIEKRAKTLLKGFGDKIFAIDITSNGRFLVSTCERYLLFYDLLSTPNDKNNNMGLFNMNKSDNSELYNVDKNTDSNLFNNNLENMENRYCFKNTLSSKTNARIPIKLSLKPEHLKHIKSEIKFTNARFSTDNLEQCIVTSIGEYVITWLLSNIMIGDLYNYSVKKVSGKIVADEYGRGTCEKIVVALENDVKVVDAKKMRRVQRR